MSTERKPGSRGVRDTSSIGRSNPASRAETIPGTPDAPQRKKGSTKTASPSKSFKKRRRK